MKIKFTKEEIESFLKQVEYDNDIVRLVDAVNTFVLDVNGNRIGTKKCFQVWGKNERCQNCTSLRAFNGKTRAFKIEIMAERVFLVESRYIEIDTKPYILEMVKDITNELYLESNLNDEVGKLIKNYNDLVVLDSLTGAYNRRFLDQQFVPSLNLCHEKNLLINIAFVDMDHFKEINDVHGHIIGDAILNYFGGYWKIFYNSRIRNKEKLIIRYGGDEFLIIGCGMPMDEFKTEFEIHAKDLNKNFLDTEHIPFEFDFTYGIASSSELNTKDWKWEDLVDLADKKMYSSKPNKRRGLENE